MIHETIIKGHDIIDHNGILNFIRHFKYIIQRGKENDKNRKTKGTILTPVIGWTTHHSIVQFEDKWYLFYHDCSLSEGVDHKRCVKYTAIKYNEDGTIQTIDPSPTKE